MIVGASAAMGKSELDEDALSLSSLEEPGCVETKKILI